MTQIEEVKSKLDVVEVISGYINLQKAGANYKANCPFHGEKTPSFFVSPERQIWHCFGCGLGGSIFDFVMQMEGVEFGDALRMLAQRTGVELKKIDPKLVTQRTRFYDICELATRFFEKQLDLSQAGLEVKKYLKQRGLQSKTQLTWRLGYAPEKWQALYDFLTSRGYQQKEIIEAGLAIKKPEADSVYDRFRSRIIFPIFDLNGLVVGFSGRIFGNAEKKADSAKYINTPSTLLYDKSQLLYGLNRAKLNIRKKDFCLLVEGQMDLLMAHQAGFENTVATSGTALTPQHLNIIKRYTQNLAMAFDMDQAGEGATKRGIDLAIQSGLNAQIISLPQGQDPADCLNKNPQLMTQAITQAQSAVAYYFSNTLNKLNPDSAETKKKIAQILLPVIKKIPNAIEQAHWLGQLAREIKTEEKILTIELDKIKLNQNELAKNPPESEDKVCPVQPEGSLAMAEHVLGLLLSFPQEIKKIKTASSYLFSQPELEEIFKSIKKEAKNSNFNYGKWQKKLPDYLGQKADSLIFKAEIFKQDNQDLKPAEEIVFCLSQLKKRYWQKELNQLNLAIVQAEAHKDKKALTNLTNKFYKLSQNLTEESEEDK